MLIPRQGSPKIVHSDNSKLTKINKDEKFHNLLGNESITWKFNLSKAPW